VAALREFHSMMIDDDTLKQLLRINDGLSQLCKSLTDKREIETSSRLIPLVDQLTHILIELARTNCSDAAIQGILHHGQSADSASAYPGVVRGNVLLSGRSSSVRGGYPLSA